MRASRHVRSARLALLALLAALWLLLAPSAGWAALSAQLDRPAGMEGESFDLRIESDNPPSGAQPDLSPLRKDFLVLGLESSSESTFLNGHYSERVRWVVHLQPRGSGTLVVPSIVVGNERTVELQVQVGPSSSSGQQPAAAKGPEHVFLEVEAGDPGAPVYVQQQLPYTLRLYYDNTLQEGALAPPSPGEAVVEQLGQEKHYTTRRDGKDYAVIERRYSITPQTSGRLRIPPATFNGTALVAHPHTGIDPRDDLLARMLRNSPLLNNRDFMDSLRGTTGVDYVPEPLTLNSQEVAIDVQPRPAQAPADWLPAQQINLHDSWADSPPRLKAGEPATRTITIEAKGVSASQIPALAITPPDHARVYAEAPDNQSRSDGKAVYGTSRQAVTYIPSSAGSFEVPPVELRWWNTRTQAAERTVLPGWKFKVEPGTAPAAVAPAAVAASPAPAPSPSVAAPDAAAAPEAAPASLLAQWQARLASLGDRGGPLLALLVAVAIAILAWRRWRARPSAAADGAAAAARKAALRNLHRACNERQPRAAAAALLDLARIEWPEDPPRGLGALAARISASAGTTRLDPQRIAAEVRALDRQLYAAAGAPWDGAALRQATQEGLRPRAEPAARAQAPLDGTLGNLYRRS